MIDILTNTMMCKNVMVIKLGDFDIVSTILPNFTDILHQALEPLDIEAI